MKYKEIYSKNECNREELQRIINNFFEEYGTKEENRTVVITNGSITITSATNISLNSIKLVAGKIIINCEIEDYSSITREIEDEYLFSLVQEKIKCIIENMLNF